jgi:hypothetical protein
MRDTAQNNAMAEIALALAMGFFSILVLTMVSMGAGAGPQAASALGLGVQVRPAAASSGTPTAAKQNLLIHYNGRVYDADLKPTDPASLLADGPLILAVAPGLRFVDVLSARKQAGEQDLTVTTLDERWLATLKEKFK